MMEIGPNDFGMQVNVKMLYQWILIHMSKLGGCHDLYDSTQTFLMLLLEPNQFFHQISHLTGFPVTCLLPGLLYGVEGLNQIVLGAAVLLEPTTLRGIVGHEWADCCLAPLAIFSSMAFLGGSSIGTSSIRPFSGHTELSRGCSCLGLAGLGFLVVFHDLHFLDILEVH